MRSLILLALLAVLLVLIAKGALREYVNWCRERAETLVGPLKDYLTLVLEHPESANKTKFELLRATEEFVSTLLSDVTLVILLLIAIALTLGALHDLISAMSD